MLVSICVITYKRPEGLQRLLNGLNNLTFHKTEPTLQVVVVDNDASGSARCLCEQLRPNFKWPLMYRIETRRGISYARNTAVACARPDTDWIAFIDDDEVPCFDWLEQLLLVQRQFAADVVYGPVVPYFPDEAPDWVMQGGFFEQSYYPTGQVLDAAYTNNVLVRADLLKSKEKPFEERFALTGGEDSYFFRNLHKAGYRMIWADEALVQEWVPQSRTTLKWILQRGYRSCLSYSTWEREACSAAKTKYVSLVKAIAQIGVGLLLVPPSLLLGRHRLTQALLRISRGAGKLSGWAGLRHEEYRTIHGS